MLLMSSVIKQLTRIYLSVLYVDTLCDGEGVIKFLTKYQYHQSFMNSIYQVAGYRSKNKRKNK